MLQSPLGRAPAAGRRSWLTALAAASLAAAATTSAENEIGFLEPFALAGDRAAALRQLIPGTEPYYFFHALHLQNQSKRAEFRTLLDQWAKRTPDSAMRRELETRQALLDYGADPKSTLDFLTRRLGLTFNHERELASAKPDLPTALDPKVIDAAEFLRLATQGTDGVDHISERGLAALVAAKHPFSPAQRRAALAKLTRPDVANLAAFIAADLATETSQGFGEFRIHTALTLAQLAELRTLALARPGQDPAAADLARNEKFVLTWLGKLRPGADENVEHDPAAREAWLERAWGFVRTLGAPFNSLKAHVLYQRLDHDRRRGVYDPARFLEYIKLPRTVGYINPRWQADERVWRFPADLNADFSAVTSRPAIGNDDPLVREFLLRLLAKADSPNDLAPWFEEAWLNAVFAEARLTAGVADPKLAEKLASALTPEAYEALKKRVDLEFDHANPRRHAPGDAVSLDVWVKNVPQLTVKLFELNTASCYEAAPQPIGTDIDLDGLVAATQRALSAAAPPLERVRHTIPLPEIAARRGVWVVELIGNGRSSRALIRKGHLSYLTRAGSAGTTLTVLDEQNLPLKSAHATFAGRRIDPQETGELVIPFTAQPGPQPVVLHDGSGFASLETITLAGEAYALDAGFHIEREQALAGGRATLAVRPRLLLNGQPVSTKLLEKVRLVLTSTDLDGIATTATVADFKLADDRESTHELKVPERLTKLVLALSGEVRSLSEAKSIPVASSSTLALNGIDRSAHVSDVFLGQAAGGWFVDERGKNGETKPERPLTVRLWHRDYAQPVSASLKTDAGGRLALGALPGIARISVKTAAGLERDWRINADGIDASSGLHALAGSPVRISTFAKASECSLLETPAITADPPSFIKDWSANLAEADGFLEARDLPPGDYSLHIRPEARVVSLRVTKGQRVKNFLVSDGRLLEATTTRPLHVPVATVEGDAFVIRVANPDPLTRVHVAATRYEPDWSLRGHLGRFAPPGLLVGSPALAESQYVSGRHLGDELRYILDRATAVRFPGVMLPRPALLLNPWAVRDTSTVKQNAQEGDRYKRAADPAAREMVEALAAERAGEEAGLRPAPDQLTASLDFLASTAPVSFNAVPDKDGVVRIPLAALGGASQVHVLALNAESAVSRTVALAAQPVKTRDLRLAAGLDPQQHFAQQDETVVVEKDKPFTLDDALSTRFETYGHLGRVFTLLQTLSGNTTLAEFSFVLDWPTFDEKKKREMYSKYACHELSFFLARKDPGFFAKAIQPSLASKKDRTFLDDYLTGQDLQRFLEPWRHGRLNTLERLLLAQRLPDQQAAEARALEDAFSLMPVNREERRRLLETALRGYALEAEVAANGPRGALEEAKQKLNEVRDLERNKSLEALDAGLAIEVTNGAVKSFTLAGVDQEGGVDQGRRLQMWAAFHDNGLTTLESKPDVLAGLAVNREYLYGYNNLGAGYSKDAQDTSLSLVLSDDEVKLRQVAALGLDAFYRALGVTQEWAENNYWKLLVAQQNAELVTPNRFWRDYAQRRGDGPFLSAHVAEAARNFSEMMLALSVLDLPFPSQAGEPEAKLDGIKLTLKPKTPLLVFHQAVKPAEVDDKGPKLLVSQSFYRLDDRYIETAGEKVDKFVGDEFLAGVVYGAQVVVTNPTSSTQKLDVLFQIPRGSRPVNGAKITQNVPLRLEAFHTHTFEVAFYFPKAGQFPHFPVHVAREGRTVAFAPATVCQVVDQLSKPDTTSWAYVSQNGTPAEVLAFLDGANIRSLDLDKIAWRLRESAEFFRAVIAKLSGRRLYHATTYSYGVRHNDPAAIREYLRHEGTVLGEAGPWLETALVTIHPVERQLIEHLEYSPLVNARAHRLGPERTILNDRFREQYQRLLGVLAHKPALDDADRLAVTYYLLLQDRIEEALAFFAPVKKANLATALQYDYAAAWLALAQSDTKTARTVAAAHADEPVDKWREKFAQLITQIDEIEGKGPAVTTPDDRDQSQDVLAAKAPGVELKVEDRQVTLDTRNLSAVTLNYYLMDLELLFSTNPFVGQDSRRFAQIVPNKAENVKLEATAGPVGAAHRTVPLPREFQNRNVLVEVVAAGQRKAQAVYANELKVTLSESFGHLEVRHTTDDRPLGKVYVKVYAEANGRPVFYKDGYTDLRGKFDYASLSTDDLGTVTRFAILVLSDDHGAVVKEAKPPRR